MTSLKHLLASARIQIAVLQTYTFVPWDLAVGYVADSHKQLVAVVRQKIVLTGW